LGVTKGVRSALRSLLTVSLGPGEGGGVYLSAKPKMRLVVAVPTEKAFRHPRVESLARRASQAAPATPIVARAPVTKAWPDALALALPGRHGSLVVLGRKPISGTTRRRAPTVASLVSTFIRHRGSRHEALGMDDEGDLLGRILSLARSDPVLARRGRDVVKLATALTGADIGGLWIREEPEGHLELVAAQRVRHAASPRPSLPASVLDELRTHPAALKRSSALRSRGQELLGAPELQSALLAPIVADEEPLGLLAVGRFRGAHPSDSESGDRLAELAALAAVSLARSIPETDRNRLTRRLGATRRITRALAEASSLDQALPVVARELRTIVEFDMLGILTVQGFEDATLLAVGSSEREPRTLRSLPGWRGSRLGDALESREAAIIRESVELLPFADCDKELREALVMPLIAGGRPLGALILGARVSGLFRASDIPLLWPAARLLAMALDEARAREATRSRVVAHQMVLKAERRPDEYSTLGRLAEVLAHEIRNPLTVIGTTMQYLRDRRLVDEQYLPLLESAVHKAREVDELLDSLFSLSRPIALRLEPASIALLLGEVAEFIRLRAAAHAIDVTVQASRRLTARLDRRVLGQALLNLALNAIDAMRGGGQLAFEARHLTGSEFIAITVSDTGTGIATESLDVIFEPYFTTKLHGTGLGLAITRRIVEEHGGSIQASSAPGRGTTFTILLVEHR